MRIMGGSVERLSERDGNMSPSLRIFLFFYYEGQHVKLACAVRVYHTHTHIYTHIFIY